MTLPIKECETIIQQIQNTSINATTTAKRVLSLIDLTNLSENDKPEDITNLCREAKTAKGNVAAICIFSKFIDFQHSKQQKYSSLVVYEI